MEPTKSAMRAKDLKLLVPIRNGRAFDTMLPFVEQNGLVIPSSRRLNKAITPRTARKPGSSCESEFASFMYWSGTMTAYVKPGEKFGKFIFYTDPLANKIWVFPSGQYEGAANSILVVEHPNYVLRTKGNRILVVPHNPESVGIVEGFPEKDGWHGYWNKNILHYPACDKNEDVFFTIRTGVVDDSAGFPSYPTYLYRIASRVGPVSCGQCWDAYINLPPSQLLGLLVEKSM